MSPSIWCETRVTKAGKKHYRVVYRLGGKESPKLAGGTFSRLTDAEARMKLIAWEIANARVPNLKLLDQIRAAAKPLQEHVDAFLASRVAVQANTLKTNRQGLGRLSRLGDMDPQAIEPRDVNEWIKALHESGLKRGTIEKALSPLRLLLDFVGVDPNPARHRTVALPYEAKEEINPPPADHVEAILRLVAPRYRLPLCCLDATAMRVGELEHHRWADIDSIGTQWRVAAKHAKGQRARWVPVPELIFDAVEAVLPREDRGLEDRVFPWFTQENLRTEMARACKAAGIPLYSPHDLRHRRISLWHRQGVSWAQIGQWAGQRSLAVTADIYTHVILDPREVDWAAALGRRGEVRDG